VTLVGEHVDYVGGRIVCMAINLTLAVAVRPSADGCWRVLSNGVLVERPLPTMARDIGDRVFASALALERCGIALPPLEIGVAGNLPGSAGLSSSAAVVTASLVAMLRLVGGCFGADELVAAAVTAERDIVGVPNGELDQRAIVHSQAHSVLVLDCAHGTRRTVPWPWPEVGVVVAHSGESHDVGGEQYRRRREAAERACIELRVASCQEIRERWHELPSELQPRARHIATETQRSDGAVSALEAGDARALGRLINQSHESLRRDYQISTDRLDGMVAAARRVPGCYGARLVGAGFGGSVIALVELGAAARCAGAMANGAGGGHGAWLVEPADGLGVTSPDVICPQRARADPNATRI
jgi:galactokinase